jgi:hypothetical protein
VESTAPIASPPSISGIHTPAGWGNSPCCPQSSDFAQPIDGFSKMIPDKKLSDLSASLLTTPLLLCYNCSVIVEFLEEDLNRARFRDSP